VYGSNGNWGVVDGADFAVQTILSREYRRIGDDLFGMQSGFRWGLTELEQTSAQASERNAHGVQSGYC
jgi:hypothetical protein